MAATGISVEAEAEKQLRSVVALAGAGLLLRGRIREGFALILASQALYRTQLLQVQEALEHGDLEEAAWLAAGYAHHPNLEKRRPLPPPERGWRPLLAVMEREGVSRDDPKGAALYAMAYTAHLGELTALLAVYDRKGIGPTLDLAQAILDNRQTAFRYGLHTVSGPLGKSG